MDKTIVITGATGGVGIETVKLFMENEWNVIGISKSTDKLSKLSEDFKGFHYFTTDIKNYDEVQKTFSSIKSQFGNIDVLVNNASIFKQKPLGEFSPNEIDDIIDTNLKGTIFCSLECMSVMSKGRIINVGSVSGLHGIKNQTIYSASKHGVNGFADSLNQESIGSGIQVSTINPGGIDTPLWNKDNPYKGDVSKLIKSNDIANIIYYIANLPDNIVLKTVTMFPTCEWH